MSKNDMHGLMRGGWGSALGLRAWESAEPVLYSTNLQGSGRRRIADQRCGPRRHGFSQRGIWACLFLPAVAAACPADPCHWHLRRLCGKLPHIHVRPDERSGLLLLLGADVAGRVIFDHPERPGNLPGERRPALDGHSVSVIQYSCPGSCQFCHMELLFDIVPGAQSGVDGDCRA